MTGPNTPMLPNRKHELRALPNKAAGASWVTGMSDVRHPERAVKDTLFGASVEGYSKNFISVR